MITGTQRIPLEAELMMDEEFYVNTTSPVVRNVVFDVAVAQRRLDTLLVVDAETELEIVEENPFVSVTLFCQRWFIKAFGLSKEDVRRKECLKRVVVEAVEAACDDPIDYTEEHTDESVKTTYENGVASSTVVRKKSRRRITKGYRSMFAASLSLKVKIKFGALKYNEANRIMVHRWLSGVVEEEYPDLRNCDKVLALERATFMSFVVSADYARFNVLFEDELMKDRLLMRFGASA
jgi:hypothetical protein